MRLATWQKRIDWRRKHAVTALQKPLRPHRSPWPLHLLPVRRHYMGIMDDAGPFSLLGNASATTVARATLTTLIVRDWKSWPSVLLPFVEPLNGSRGESVGQVRVQYCLLLALLRLYSRAHSSHLMISIPPYCVAGAELRLRPFPNDNYLISDRIPIIVLWDSVLGMRWRKSYLGPTYSTCASLLRWAHQMTLPQLHNIVPTLRVFRPVASCGHRCLATARDRDSTPHSSNRSPRPHRFGI